MATNTEIQESLKGIFRRTELEARQARMAIIQNHLKLEHETLSADEIEMDKKLAISKARQRLMMKNKLGYWSTLWMALRGKL
jgi:hypothetical protein